MTAGQGALPRPFYREEWPSETRAAAAALWGWHLGLQQAAFMPPAGTDPSDFGEAERQRALDGTNLSSLPAAVSQAAYQACRAHRLPRDLLAAQVAGAEMLRGPLRFATVTALNQFIDAWAVSHGCLLGALADARGAWQQPLVAELSRAFFLTSRLVYLPRDLARDLLFLPEADLEQAGVTLGQLREGQVDEAMRKLLWKQSIRARDAYAQGLPLVNELAPRFSRALKRWWLAGLEVLNEVQRRDYDVWTAPTTLSWYHRLQVRLQARFGRASFRSR